jgi:glyoxylase-like metal-dependent hydrolase (beta-lactamase superfamily II)
MSQALPASPRRRRWLAAVLSLLILAVVVIVGYRRQSGEDKPAPPARGPVLGPYALMVAPGIYHLGGLQPAVAYVVETSDGLVLIDSGLDRDARLVRQEIASLGLDLRRLRAILLTHVHGDHSGGA